MTNNVSMIPARLRNASKEHPYVAGAVDIYDDEKGKDQEQVNSEVDATFALHQTEINALDSQNYVSFAAGSGDTLSDILPAEGAVDTIYRVGFWDGSANSGAGGMDATVYSEYAWDAANSEYKLMDVKTAIGEVFDVSLYNASGGVLATYASLNALLSNANLSTIIPTGVRKGGMSIKFVQSSDNKYVQYRYMGTAVTGNPNPFLDTANWQGVDNNIVQNSRNLITSGAVFETLFDEEISLNGSVTIGNALNMRSIPYADYSIKVGDKITFKLNDPSNAVRKYFMRSGSTNIFSTADFSSNVEYTEEVVFVDSSLNWGLYIIAQNAIGNGNVQLDVDIHTGRLTDLENKLEDDVTEINDRISVLPSLEQDINQIEEDLNGSTYDIEKTATYNTALSIREVPLSEYPLEEGDTISFRLVTGTAEIRKYKMRYYTGSTDIFGEGEDFEPNVTYTKKVLNNPPQVSTTWGPYILAANVLASGDLTFQVILTTGIKEEIKENIKHVWTKGKKAYCLGDSLTASPYADGETGRKWMANFVSLAGTNTDLKWQYDNHIAWGGTRTLQANNLSGQMRARNLLSLITPDIVFIQNINDAQYYRAFGNVTDEPFMTSEINDVSVTPLSDEASAQNYFIENLSSCLTGITAKHGVIMKVPYEIENGKILTLSGSVTTSGTISISFGSGVIVYGIEIEVGDSIEDIVDKIVEYDYGGVGVEDAKISSNQVSFATNETVNITNGNGELGIICTVTSGAAVSYTSFCFVSHDVSNWLDTAYWKPIMQVSLISQYKGLIEYLLTNAPKCRIYMLGFPRMILQYDSNTYKRADGTWNWDTFKAAYQTSYDLAETQKKAAEYMNVQYFDIFTDSGINIYNMETFYYGSNNVHFNNDGYDRLGETVYRKLI